MITEEDIALAIGRGRSDKSEEEGLAFLKEQAREHPDWANVRRAIVHRLSRSQWAEALDTFAELGVLCPDDSWVYRCWIDALLYAGRQEKAVEVGRTYLTRHPHDCQVIYVLGDLIGEEGISLYQQGLAQNEDNWLYLVHFATLLSRFNHWDAAVSVWRMFLAGTSEHPIFESETETGYHNLGEALANLGRHSDAIEAFQKVTELNPDSSWTWYELGRSCEATQQSASAIVAYQQVLRIFHSGSFGHYDLTRWAYTCERIGLLLELASMIEEAKPYFDQTQRLDPAKTLS